ADRVGYRRVLLGADLLYAALVVPAFQAIDRGVAGSAAAAILSLSVVHAFSNGPIPALLTHLLPTHLRYTGIALGYHLALPRLRPLRRHPTARRPLARQDDPRSHRSRLVHRGRRARLVPRHLLGDPARRPRPLGRARPLVSGDLSKRKRHASRA